MITCLEPDQEAGFDALGARAGLLGSYELMRRHEDDGRWSARYLRCTGDDGELLGMVPLYAFRGRSWNGNLFDPGGWGLEEFAGDGVADATAMRPDRVLLAGGCFGIPTSLHLSPKLLDSASSLRVVLERMEAVAAAEGRTLFFPYLLSSERRALDLAAAPGRVRWAAFGADAVMREVSAGDWPSRLSSRIRRTLRQDAERSASYRMESGTCQWEDVEDQACLMIAAHNIQKGADDHPEYVRLRYRELARLRARCVVFTTRWGGRLALATALAWRDELAMFEVGLPAAPGPDRHAAYVEVAFGQSLRYAREQGLRTVRFGIESPVPKAARGAVFDDVYCGVLLAR